MGILDDFFAEAQAKAGSLFDSDTVVGINGDVSVTGLETPTPSATIGSQLFDVIYAAAAGRTQQARDKIAAAFLGTNEGKKIQAAGIQQTVMKYLPFIALGILGIFLLGTLAKR